MATLEAQKAGGRATAIISRQRAIERYYMNPSVCKECNKVIEVGNQKIQTIRQKKFCNNSCSASHNNRTRLRNGKPPEKTKYCADCGKVLLCKKSKKCQSCKAKRNFVGVAGQISKKELSTGKYWVQWRAKVTQHARRVYKVSLKPYKCLICNYDKHVDICHIKPVAKFADDALLSKINDINNLVALCPNHHWEYDHGLIKLI